jgi:anti-anti-sigma factor
MLTASVGSGESGPLIVLSGESDLTGTGQLNALITAQLSTGTRQLTIDASELSFADSMSIRILVRAARTLNERGGRLVLLRPQPAVARILEIMGADQAITIRAETHGEPEREDRAGSPPPSSLG